MPQTESLNKKVPHTLIRPIQRAGQTEDDYKASDGRWYQLIRCDGRVSIGDNHELVKGKPPEGVANDRGWSQPHLQHTR